MNTQHIPASWELRQSTSGYWFIDYEQGGEGYTLTKLECGERDARLIAAAPELLAFAERVANLPEFAHYLTLIDAARELVVKAGTAPAREVTT